MRIKFTVQIKQQTPLIHFQWEQPGATLRASEVKPKLDKFLKKKNIKKLEGLFGEKDNLPYRLTIEKSEEEEFDNKIDKFPCFFANIDAASHGGNRFGFVFDKEVKLHFTSFHSEVIEAIKENISEFLFTTNFGTRQSKGFGSFYTDERDPCYKNPVNFNYFSYFNVNLNINVSNSKDLLSTYRDLFKQIELFYKDLRGRMLYKYAKLKRWGWDKTFFKKRFIKNFRNINTSKKEYYLVRDLLGLAPSHRYKVKGQEISLKYENEEIERFQSPILFKPISFNNQFKVFLILSEIPEEFLNHEFRIIKKINGKIDEATISTPESFDLKDFLNFAIDNALKRSRFNKLSQIYFDLKRNRRNNIHGKRGD